MFSEDFFALNSNTHFSFPHENCDEIPTEELKAMFFHPEYFCQHIVRYFVEPTDDIMKRLRSHPQLGEMGAAFMRLKFLAEVLDIRRMLPRLRNQKKAGGFLKDEVSRIWEWERERETVGMERYAAVDVLANHMCNAVIETIKAIVRNTDIPDFSQLATAAVGINVAIPQIRAKPCDRYAWNDVDPHALANYPYFVFVVRSWDALEPHRIVMN